MLLIQCVTGLNVTNELEQLNTGHEGVKNLYLFPSPHSRSRASGITDIGTIFAPETCDSAHL